MTGLRTISPAERLLETLRHIVEIASFEGEAKTMRAAIVDIVFAARLAIVDYEAAQRVVRTANSLVVKGELNGK